MGVLEVIKFNPKGIDRDHLFYNDEDPYRAYVRLLIESVNGLVEKEKEITKQLEEIFLKHNVEKGYVHEKLGHAEVRDRTLREYLDEIDERFLARQERYVEEYMHRHRQAIRAEIEGDRSRLSFMTVVNMILFIIALIGLCFGFFL